MKILIADDETNLRTTLISYCALEGIDAIGAENGLSAQRQLQTERFDAVVLDLRMPGMDGLELLAWLRDEGPDSPVIVVSAHGDVSDAVEALKRGARDYLTKPFDPDELIIRLRREVELDRLRRAAPRPEQGEPWSSPSPAMAELLRLASRVAPTDSTVLITGESGTGKEVMARRLHDASPRAAGPFVAINLGAVPESLLESELFGYEKGAFTGAQARKQGLFETATGGTLFLDEIGEMPVQTQVKLLRAIQERKIQRLGGTTPIPIDVRFLAATNVDLEAKIAEGTFREDLLYRLNVFELRLPPLRERPEEIAVLAPTFAQSRGRHISEGAVRRLQRYPFPGNIRELQNIVERAAVLTDSTTIDVDDLALPAGASPPLQRDAPSTLRDIERAAIRDALYRNEWHRERTAAELGITRRTLLNKINEYGIADERTPTE